MLRFAILSLSLLTLVGCQSARRGSSDQPMHHESADHSNESAMQQHTGSHAAHTQKGPQKQPATADEAKGHERHHDFDEPGQYAQRWNAPERDKWQKPSEVIEHLGIEPGMTVVDLGTGTGYFLPHLSKAVGKEGKVIGLDVSTAMLEYVENETLKDAAYDNVETALVKRNDPMLSATSVDRILTVNVWHHVTHRPQYAKKLLSALTPGGRFVVVDYTKDADRGPPKKIRLKPKTVVNELRKAGFKAKIVQESLPKQYMVVATKPTD